MNRYTFKAKRKDNGEWVYGNVIINPNSTDKVVIIESGVTSYSSTKEAILEFINDYVEIIPETLCQCTGLQDRDGKDIFENDIINEKYYVLFVCGQFDLIALEDNCWEDSLYNYQQFHKNNIITGTKFDKEED